MKRTGRGAWFWAGLSAVLLFDVWLRCHAVGPAVRNALGIDLYFATSAESEPLDCDEAIYGYIGKRLAAGAVMYRDLTENKPPGGYWIYAAAVALGGTNELTVRLLPIPFVAATVLLVGCVARRLGGNCAGLTAALVFAFASTDPFLYGESANMEHMINAFSFASLALLIAAWGRPGRGRIIGSGVALGAACLIKQTSALNLPLFALALLFRGRAGGTEFAPPRPLKSRAWDVISLAAGFSFVLGFAVAVLSAQGAAPSAFDDIVRYGGALATDTPTPPNAPPLFVRWVTGNAAPDGKLPWPFGSTDYLVWWGTGSWPLWLAAVPAAGWLALGGPTNAARRLVALWTLSAWVQVAMPRLFWAHYYLLPVPGLAVSLGVFFVEFATRAFTRSKTRPRDAMIAAATAAAIVGLAGLQVVEYLRVPPEGLVRDRGGTQWVVNRELGREIGRRSVVWDKPTLFVWGWQGPLYFYSGLDGVTRQVFVDDFMKAFAGSEHPLVRPRIAQTMRSLREHPPALVFTGYPPFPDLKTFLDERYLPSRLAPGLHVERSRYGAFETFGAR